jgi:hypothetical protein
MDEWNTSFVVGSGKSYVSEEAIIQLHIFFTWIKCSVDMLNKLLNSAATRIFEMGW